MHGKDWQKVTDHVGSRTKKAIRNFGTGFRKALKDKPNSKDGDLIEILDNDKLYQHWSTEETDRFK